MTMPSRWIKSNSRRAVLALAALAAFAEAPPLSAATCDVTIVRDAEIRPYRDAIRGLQDACGCTAEELKLAEGGVVEHILRGPPGAVVAVGTAAFKKIKAIQGLPVIYLMVMPSETGASGDNVSGVSMDVSSEVSLNTMAELFPDVKKIGLLYDPRHTGALVEGAVKAARDRGIALEAVKIRNVQDIPAALENMRAVGVYWMLPDPTVVSPEAVNYLLLQSFRSNIPVFSFSRKYVEMGALAALSVNPYDMGVQAGEIVKAVCEGGKGPVREHAKKTRLVINTKIAAKMRTRISDEVIRKADRIDR